MIIVHGRAISNLSTFIANKEAHKVDNILLKDYLHCKITHYGYTKKAFENSL